MWRQLERESSGAEAPMNNPMKLAGFNLADNRAMIDSDGTYYVFQVGRQVQVTLEGKL
jgi:hypothetical protein